MNPGLDKADEPAADRLARLKLAFNEALSCQPEHRARYLAVLRAGSASLAQEVSRYLKHYYAAEEILEPPPPSRPATFKPNDLVAGRFRIVRLLGQGGMGEVYETIDLVLRQPVALKTIRPDFAADASTRARFQGELQLARRVTHPNVCRMFELWQEDREGQDPLVFLTMEMLEGETLAARLARSGRFEPAAALPLLEQLASALDAIHQLNIIHRDLKPSNVHVVPGVGGESRVSVTDFGLARLTVGDQMLTTGFAGTPAYMAPEQFDRGECSVASDVYAFGVIGFEMLTGQRQPLVPPRSVNPALDQRWDDFILRCVAQDPRKRPASAQALLADLRDLAGATRSPWRRRAVIGAVLAVTLSAVAMAATMVLGGPPPVSAEFTRLTFDPGLSWDVGASADGARIVYSSDRATGEGFQIWTQGVSVGGGQPTEPLQLTHGHGHAVSPAISPDGRLVVYRSETENGGIDVVPAAGGTPKRLAPFGRHPRFSPDGSRIAYWTGVEGDHALPSGKLWIVDVNGGAPRQLHSALVDARFPAWSPDGRWILFRGSQTPGPGWDAGSEWYVTDPDGRQLVSTGAFAAFTAGRLTLHDGGVLWQPGRVIFAARAGHSTNLWSIPIADGTGAIVGAPQRLTSGSNLETSPWPIAGGFLAYTNWGSSGQIWRVWTSGTKAGQSERMTQTDALDTRPSVSADGQRLIFTRRLGEARNLWFKDLVSGKETALLSGAPVVPVLSPDGQSVAYTDSNGSRRPISLLPATGGRASVICEDCGEVQSWSRDGSWLLFLRQTSDGQRTLEALDLASRHSRPLVRDETLSEGSVSPDGSQVAFSVRRGGVESRIYVAPVRGSEAAPRSTWRPLTPEREWADKPRWTPDGRTMYYYSTRDGFGCIWRLSPDGPAEAQPTVVHHLHDGRYAILHLSRQAFAMSAAPDFVAYNAPDARGNLWTMTPAPPPGALAQAMAWLRARLR
jgi:Tol biopolymer transport system component